MTVRHSGVARIDNWGEGKYSYIMFWTINFFWKQLFFKVCEVNMNIWIFTPPIIDAGYATGEANGKNNIGKK